MDNVSIIINSVVSLRQFLPSRSLVFSVGDIVGLAGEEGKHLGQLPSFCRLQRYDRIHLASLSLSFFQLWVWDWSALIDCQQVSHHHDLRIVEVVDIRGI